VADIVRLVEAAQARTAPVQRFADVVAVGAAAPPSRPS
jgi:cation transport ATPase